MNGADVLILDAVRTPIGRHGGALARVRPDDLAAVPIAALMERNPGLAPEAIDDVVLGDANGAGEDNRNVARMAGLLAGLPVHVPGTTVNRLCASGLEAVVQAARAVAVGDADVCIAGGVESMSRAPLVMLRPEQAFARDGVTLHSTTLGWRMVNPRHRSEWTASLGEGAEIAADEHAITRDAQDRWALRSHQRASLAWDSGAFASEITSVPGAALVRDEAIRPDTSAERLAALAPSFLPDGSVTAGNSSPLSDGSAALVLASERGAQEAGIDPIARVVSSAVVGVEPHRFAVAPVEAANRALARAGLGWQDIDLVELNEAFAAQVLACLKGWPELDPERVNVLGGAIALGHPLGCSGARVLTTLTHELRRRGARYGLATLCIGVGQGIALIVESTS